MKIYLIKCISAEKSSKEYFGYSPPRMKVGEFIRGELTFAGHGSPRSLEPTSVSSVEEADIYKTKLAAQRAIKRFHNSKAKFKAIGFEAKE